MNIDSLNEYSLWLEPAGDDFEKIQNVINELSQKAGVASFVPHVTLLGNIHYDPNKIVGELTTLSQDMAAFEIRFSRLSIADFYLKCFFLECDENPTLLELNRKAQGIFGHYPDFKPHMSLLYGDIDEELKKGLAKEVEGFGIDSFTFHTNRITLWHAMDTPNNWKRL